MKKGFYVHCELAEDRIYELFDKKIIGNKGDKPVLGQLPKFENRSLVFCDYICKGYLNSYLEQGIIFETNEKPIYAIPTDSWNFMRSANWIPGHEKFIFSSLEEMLKKYPNYIDFEKDFKKLFQALSPQEIYPNQNLKNAKMFYNDDSAHKKIVPNLYNEIAFNVPLKIKPIGLFFSKKDLRAFAEKNL